MKPHTMTFTLTEPFDRLAHHCSVHLNGCMGSMCAWLYSYRLRIRLRQGTLQCQRALSASQCCMQIQSQDGDDAATSAIKVTEYFTNSIKVVCSHVTVTVLSLMSLTYMHSSRSHLICVRDSDLFRFEHQNTWSTLRALLFVFAHAWHSSAVPEANRSSISDWILRLLCTFESFHQGRDCDRWAVSSRPATILMATYWFSIFHYIKWIKCNFIEWLRPSSLLSLTRHGRFMSMCAVIWCYSAVVCFSFLSMSAVLFTWFRGWTTRRAFNEPRDITIKHLRSPVCCSPEGLQC